MKNREKIYLLIILLLAASLAGLVFKQNEAVAIECVSMNQQQLDYAFVVDDLDADEMAAFCSNY